MSIRLFDGHCDTAFELYRKQEHLLENSGHIDLKKASGLSSYAQVFAFCSLAGLKGLKWSSEELLSEPLQYLLQEIQENSAHIAVAYSKEELSFLHAAGKIAAMFGMEGAELISCDPHRLCALREQGFVMTTLTWNADNVLAGCHTSDQGLTFAGKDFVSEAQLLGLRIDVSHLSEKAFWDLISVTKAPILASHSNCRAICDHSRNLTDDQLRAIGDTGGTVGLNLYPLFLGESADFDLLRKHLDHMLLLCGEKHVSLGGDLDGCDTLARGFCHVGDYTSFYSYLSLHGYSKALLDDIFFNNLMRIL